MGFTLQGVLCPNLLCDGYIVLTPEEVDFVRLEGWESHLNVSCLFCKARFQVHAIDLLEREVTATFIAANYRKRFPKGADQRAQAWTSNWSRYDP